MVINIVIRGEISMTRHHSYSKRSRESRKAMRWDAVDDDLDDDYVARGDRLAGDWSLADANFPSNPGG